MNNPNFFHFSALPLSTRMVYTMTLLVLGTGYLFAMLQVFYSHHPPGQRTEGPDGRHAAGR